MASAAGHGRLIVETGVRAGVIGIAFQDDGPGISREHQRKILDPFFTTKADGTGLGLSISYGIIKEHGGEISVRSVPDKGTTFLIELPIVAPSSEASDVSTRRHAADALSDPPAAPKSGITRVLIVDDDEALLGTLSDVVRALGHEDHATSSGAEALEIAATLRLDVAVIDLNMPGGVSGLDLLKRLIAAQRGIRVIVHTGSVDPGLERESRALGASDFLRKPVDLDSLERAIARAVGSLSQIA